MDAWTLCMVEARRLAAIYHWCLLPLEAWAAQARELVPSEATDRAARNACLTVYSRLLYAACQDGDRQAQAYAELHRYLWSLARHLEPELADDAAQRAIELICAAWRHEAPAKRPRSASTFLRFAQLKLREARNYERRLLQKSRREAPSEPPASAECAADGDDILEQTPHPGPPVDEVVIDREGSATRAHWLVATRHRVAYLAFDCLQKLWRQPRSPRKQLKAVILTFMEHLPDLQIADLVGITPENVQVLRSHGLDRIGACLSVSLASLKGAAPCPA